MTSINSRGWDSLGLASCIQLYLAPGMAIMGSVAVLIIVANPLPQAEPHQG